MKFTIARVDVLLWALIYGGLLVFAVGLALRGFDPALAPGISIAGLVLATGGAVLIWVRSRMVAAAQRASRPKPEEPSPPESTP